MNDTLAVYLDRYLEMRLGGGSCSDSDIEKLEFRMSVRLPAAYKAYLRLFGGKPPSAWVGTDCTLIQLPSLQIGAEELLCENSQPALPSGSFVFSMHQGYQFYFFISDGKNDDPPVFYYLEGQPGVVRRFERFSDLVVLLGTNSDQS